MKVTKGLFMVGHVKTQSLGLALQVSEPFPRLNELQKPLLEPSGKTLLVADLNAERSPGPAALTHSLPRRSALTGLGGE